MSFHASLSNQGRQITGSNARAWIEKEKPPIKKNDGWFVFTDLRPGCYTVNAEGGQFILSSKNVNIPEGSMQMLRNWRRRSPRSSVASCASSFAKRRYGHTCALLSRSHKAGMSPVITKVSSSLQVLTVVSSVFGRHCSNMRARRGLSLARREVVSCMQRSTAGDMKQRSDSAGR